MEKLFLFLIERCRGMAFLTLPFSIRKNSRYVKDYILKGRLNSWT